jgi:hypothetical protein
MRRKKLAGKSKSLQIKGESQRRRNLGGKTEDERQRRNNFGGKKEGETEEEARVKEEVLTEKQKVKQRKRRETKKNKFERENEGIAEEEARDKEKKF